MVLHKSQDQGINFCNRIGAPSYQARKLYGDAMPGDITHEDVLKHFSEFFKYYIRNLPKQNPFISADDVKECITPCFQV